MRILLPVVIVSVLYSSNVIGAVETIDSEMKKLQGGWKFISLEIEGRKRAPEKLADGSWTFKEMVVSFNDPRAPGRASLVVDPQQSPKVFDLTGLDGVGKEKVSLGIYKFEGDHLIICLRNPDSTNGRPTEFKTEPGSESSLITLERVKK